MTIWAILTLHSLDSPSNSLVRTPLERLGQLNLDLLNGRVQLPHPLVLPPQLRRELVRENSRGGVVMRFVDLRLEARDLRLKRADLSSEVGTMRSYIKKLLSRWPLGGASHRVDTASSTPGFTPGFRSCCAVPQL